MTALARLRTWLATVVGARGLVRLGVALALGAACLEPAAAQVAASVGLESAYRVRGHSVSAGHPVATLDLSYDDKSGVYLGAGGTVVLTGGDPGLLAVRGDIGFAKRVAPRLTVDLGVTHTQYTERRGLSQTVGYTELYAGVTRGVLSSRLYYSPNYLGAGIGTLYGEVELAIEPVRNWSLSGHAGKLAYVANRPSYAGRAGQYDWSLAASRRLGAVDAHVAVSGGGPGRDYYLSSLHRRTAVTAGVSYSF